MKSAVTTTFGSLAYSASHFWGWLVSIARRYWR